MIQELSYNLLSLPVPFRSLQIQLQFVITPGAIQKFTAPSLLHKGLTCPQTPPTNT